ncbi:MAG: cyclopropane-fatty-acyl-phospholipid synthase family protein [Roseitalea porphyridii]|jgi:cyclopropane-fatty-acyl-phospholipid synthase|uniref:cyclopropane-fatty-acyl-phospholipid synthase family protein n=1 Tax=Roseitalea porphyridii TaxID=1852022 RepID=UPI0032EEB44F
MASTNMMRGSGDVVREVIAAAEPLTKNNIGRYLRGLPFKAKLALRAALHLPQGSLTIRLPDRRTVRIDGHAPGPDGVLILHNWNLARKAISGGTIGVAESYMDGDWESPDVTTFLELFVVNEELSERLATAGATVKFVSRIRHWFNRNTKTRAQKNIAAHYDLGNDFYALWLDPSMTYSSALYETGANSLESAQAAKYRALAEAAGITRDDHVLEIGCGWGGFAEFAAREIGCRVTGLTISREQFDFARERIRLAGLNDKVTIKFQDYRDETERYDKVVSIEMFEAVGEEYWETYFAKVRDVLKPGGKAGLQIITIDEKAFPIYRKQPDFIQRYVFPGGMLPPPSALHDLGTRHALQLIGERIFPQDYARTLSEWRDRFWQAWPQINAMGFDERFKRLWEFYLYYCEAGFRAEFIDVRQLTFARNG